MKKYSWRNRVTASSSNVQAKLAVKTEHTNWLETKEPVVVPISINSKFHNPITGDLKMEALLSSIKSSVKGPITILFTEKAHLLTEANTTFTGNKELAREDLFSKAAALKNRYERHFEGCKVVFWEEYISQDTSYEPSYAFVEKLYKEDILFKEQIFKDLAAPDESGIYDLLEQCTCQLVLASKGYRFQFYPGSPYASTEYVSGLLSPLKRTVWITVFLSIERKKLMAEI